MKCDLCQLEKQKAVRVNAWIVCRDCSSSGVLRTALEAQAKIKQLRGLVSAAQLNLESKVQLQREAVDRLTKAQEELDAAILALIPLIAESAEAKLDTRDAQANVKSYETAHPFFDGELDSRNDG